MNFHDQLQIATTNDRNYLLTSPIINRCMSGDITLHVPSGFSMELELEIAYTRNSRQDYRIDAPFELEELRTREWDYDHGSPRKFIRSSGSNGGANHVKIETVNGNITIVEGR